MEHILISGLLLFISSIICTITIYLKNHQIKGNIEGHPECGWIIVDFGSILVHLFSPDQREFYRLEDLWNEGKIVLHLQ